MTERKAKGPSVIEVAKIETVTMGFAILGTRPIILNRLSEKTKRELLAPSGKKTQAQKQSSLKHDPYAEFRAAPYVLKESTSPTYLAVMSSAFKAAMATAALDLPGTRKAQIGRLVWVEDDYTPLYGIPLLSMAPVRSSDMNHTPDIRTRVLVRDWACFVKVTFVETLIKTQAIANLLAAGGLTAGIGDWRPEKGKNTHGQFMVVHEAFPAYCDIVAKGGRTAQIAAMDCPEPADADTEDLLAWWMSEVKRRGFALTEEDDDALLDGAETDIEDGNDA